MMQSTKNIAQAPQRYGKRVHEHVLPENLYFHQLPDPPFSLDERLTLRLLGFAFVVAAMIVMSAWFAVI